MQATLEIDDEVLATARAMASDQDVPLDDVVNNLLRYALEPKIVYDPELRLPILAHPPSARKVDLAELEKAIDEMI